VGLVVQQLVDASSFVQSDSSRAGSGQEWLHSISASMGDQLRCYRRNSILTTDALRAETMQWVPCHQVRHASWALRSLAP